jgi:xanthine phosphoribosyltransferase
MNFLEEKIRKCGTVLPGNVLEVNDFLNHQIDVALLDKLGENFAELFKGVDVTKILTIEASGIPVACSLARAFNNIPVVFARKHHTSNIAQDVYYSTVWSYTNSRNYNVSVSKKYIQPSDKFILADDFLANGNAVNGLIEIVESVGAKVQGVCVAIEKGFQGGGDALREKGYRVESGAIIDKMSYDGTIVFRK